MKGSLVPVGSNDVLNGLRALDDETLLAVGYTTLKNRRLAAEHGNTPLAQLHGMVSVLVDRALLERTNARGPEVREYIMRDDDGPVTA